jgi:hypothetical protein
MYEEEQINASYTDGQQSQDVVLRERAIAP